VQISIIFPHQLFDKSPLPLQGTRVILIEEFLFFRQYTFHKQKIAWQRAAMKAYADRLTASGIDSTYISSYESLSISGC
jgi:deoxyribodipyrimidine photolyase-related protein